MPRKDWNKNFVSQPAYEVVPVMEVKGAPMP